MPLPRPLPPPPPEKKAPKLDEAAIQKLLTEADALTPELDHIMEQETKEMDQVTIAAQQKKTKFLEQRRDLIKKIPNFWLKAFQNHSILSNTLSPLDEQLFAFLEEIDVKEDGTLNSQTTITFVFKPNPILSGTKVWKTFTPVKDVTAVPPNTTLCEDEGTYYEVSQSEVKWTKAHPTEETKESFMMFFHELDPVHLTVMRFIKDELWANPLGFFLGEVDSSASLNPDFDDDGEEGEDFEGEEGGEGDE